MKGVRRSGTRLALVLTTAFGAASAIPAAAFGAEKAADVPAHVLCMRALQQVADMRGETERAMARNDFAALARLYEDIRGKIREAQAQMDRAFLAGAWKAPAYKRDAAELIGQIEGVEILNFISLAFLNGYEYPTKKVPPYVIDSTARMFTHLDGVNEKLQSLNRAMAAKQ